MIMIVARPPTIAIKQESLYEKLTQNAVERKMTLVDYTNELLMMSIERDQFLSKYFPYLEKISINGNKIVLKDHKLKQYCEITKKNQKIFCDLDESFDCVHIQFALSLLEIGRFTE